MKILFMGTPTFASTALDMIAKSRFGAELCGVVTKVDTPKDRGHKLLPSPVKVTAEALGLPVFQPETFKDGAFKETLDMLSPDVIIVAAYGKILPKYVLDAPKKYGCINIHGSLLPKYRGAAPIQRAIMNGEREIGVTIMKMDAGLDTGDMLMRRALTFDGESFGEIYDALARLGGEMIVETLENIDSLVPEKQDDALATYANKIEKSDCVVDFSRRAKEINDKIRALSPAPCAAAKLNGKLVKFTKAAVIDGNDGKCGEIVAVGAKGDGYIDVMTGSGALRVLRLIPEGKKEMSAGDFVRGRGCAAGDVFENDIVT